MPKETEIKLKLTDEKAFHRALQRLKAVPASKNSPRLHEFNVIFDHPGGTLAKRGQLLRIRTETAEPPRKKGAGRKGVAPDGIRRNHDPRFLPRSRRRPGR